MCDAGHYENHRREKDRFEMWCWGRMLRIPRTARKTNASIVEEMEIPSSLSRICLTLTLEFFGQTEQREDSHLGDADDIG